MKKAIVFIIFAALLAASCAKVVETGRVDNREISFQTATFVTKANTAFPTTENFSVYAWAAGTVGPYFMNNTTIGFNGTEWRPVGETYYWPKEATVDFIGYYPAGMSGITVAEDQITYAGIDVNTLQEDIMYTDKAAAFSNNVDLMDDGANAYTGVPMIFRHALAKVKFQIELVYNKKTEADGTVTEWEVAVNSVGLSGVYTTGGCTLNLENTPTTGLIAWQKPQDANGYNVWTNNGTIASINGSISTPTAVTPGNTYDAVDEIYVLPQTLTAGAQKVDINLTIKTKRNGADFLNETLTRSADILVTSLPAWEMNHVYTYVLRLAPLKSDGSDPSNPGGIVDPEDPYLDNEIITFDPAVDGWDNVGVITTINI